MLRFPERYEPLLTAVVVVGSVVVGAFVVVDGAPVVAAPVVGAFVVVVIVVVVDVVGQTGAASVTGSSGRHFLLQHFPLDAGTCSTISKLREPLRHVAD
jgi:hypothetical protein